MSGSQVTSTEEKLVGAEVVQALRAGVARRGSAVLFVPTFAQALDAQRVLAQDPGLLLGVSVTTPDAWLKERMELWGDGRTLADGVVLAVLSRQVLADADPSELGPMRPSAGLVRLLSRLADQALPWLPLDESGHARSSSCEEMGLTQAETLLVGLVGSLGRLLAAHGYATRAEASILVPQAIGRAGARVPAVVVAGLRAPSRRVRELLDGLAALGEVTVVERPQAVGRKDALPEGVSWCGNPARDKDIGRLLDAIFSGNTTEPVPEGPVEFLLATGPVAEAELMASRVTELVAGLPEDATQAPVPPVVVAVPDVARAKRELLPKLAARGVRVRVQGSLSLADIPDFRAFFSFARTVARLEELRQTWPEDEPGIDGPVRRLGDMSWWPPRELVDFLLSDLSGMEPSAAWRLDAQWRGNRLLTPEEVLRTLQLERRTSGPVARATAELLRGRVGSAAAKLLAPFVRGDAATRVENSQARMALQEVLRLAGTLHDLGISADPTAPGAVSLGELLRLCEWAAQGAAAPERWETLAGDLAPQVLVTGLADAAALPPCSAQALLVAGCTSAEQPIGVAEDLLHALLELTGVEPAVDPMEEARAAFLSLMRVPTRRLVLERVLNDADGGEAYPSVMLSELLAAYGIEAGASPDNMPLPTRKRAETDLVRNRSSQGGRPPELVRDDPSPAGRLTERTRGLVFVGQGGEQRPDDRPVLSASQVETYLECPYKWFSLRRLRLGMVDAGHGGMEMGTFAHRVLERTHGALLARALGEDALLEDEKALRAAGEAHLCDPLEGSRVSDRNLDEAREVLEREFLRHQQHMRMARRPHGSMQLLVAHDSFERAQEERLRDDLISCLGYETRILEGFEPRLFEWSFGRGDDLVSYAGAYFTGTVDRIDVSPHGTAVILDYKHKSTQGFASEYDALQDGVGDGACLPNRVQSLIYAQVVRRAFEGRLRLVGTVYLATKSDHALAGAADEDVADLVFGRLRSNRQARVCVPRTAEGGPGMEDLLDRCEELVAEQVKQMMAGNVEARPRDWRSCSFCPVMQCEKRMVR